MFSRARRLLTLALGKPTANSNVVPEPFNVVREPNPKPEVAHWVETGYQIGSSEPCGSIAIPVPSGKKEDFKSPENRKKNPKEDKKKTKNKVCRSPSHDFNKEQSPKELVNLPKIPQGENGASIDFTTPKTTKERSKLPVKRALIFTSDDENNTSLKETSTFDTAMKDQDPTQCKRAKFVHKVPFFPSSLSNGSDNPIVLDPHQLVLQSPAETEKDSRQDSLSLFEPQISIASIHPDEMRANEWYGFLDSGVVCSPTHSPWKQSALQRGDDANNSDKTPDKNCKEKLSPHANGWRPMNSSTPNQEKLTRKTYSENDGIGNFDLSLSLEEDSDFVPNSDEESSKSSSQLCEEPTSNLNLHPAAGASNTPLSNNHNEEVPDFSFEDLHMDLNLGVPTNPNDEPEEQHRKRTRRYVKNGSHERTARKKARNSGQHYVTSKGKVISAKSTKELLPCRNNCAKLVSPDVASYLCNSLWALGDHNKRRMYLSSLIQCKPTATSRKRTVSPRKQKNRRLTVVYQVPVNGENKIVCKGCFLKIFDVTKKTIDIIAYQKSASPLLYPHEDQRGKDNPTALSEEKRLEVLNHIQSFPVYKSHYSRKQTDKKYLPSHLDLASMYLNYSENYAAPVSRWTYEREFHKLGLSFKVPKTDTCVKCDRLQQAIVGAENEVTKRKHKQELELHHRKAEKAIDRKTQDKQHSKQQPENRKVISFDLQQCLPTPSLPTSVVFFKRQLWTYNLTLHDSTLKKVVNAMWHEGIAKRGANEVGSAVYDFIINLPDCVEEVTFWSDTCGGQNKNNIVNAMFHAALSKKKSLRIINQKFLVVGHTHLECDNDHSQIEAKKKKAVKLYLPRDYYNLVATCGARFSVVEMNQQKQYNFSKLLEGSSSPLVKRKKNTDKCDFKWKDAVWFQYDRSLPSGVVKYKSSHDEDYPFCRLDMRRFPGRGSPTYILENTYSGPVPINAKKKENLLELLPLIDEDCHPFYQALITDARTPNIDPDIHSEVDSEDSDYNIE